MMDKLPKKITPCHISDCVCELRFTSLIPEDALFGVIYIAFKDEFPEVAKDPVLELPASIRANEPDLQYSAHYQMLSEKFLIKIGPRVFSLSVRGDYIGWEAYKNKLIETFKKVSSLNVFAKDQITRLGLRYINLFPQMDILTNSSLTLMLGEESLIDKKTNIAIEIPSNKAISMLKIVNSASMIMHGENITGSIIDIDVSLNPQEFKTYESMIEYAHDAEKALFFSTLSKEYISTLNPEY